MMGIAHAKFSVVVKLSENLLVGKFSSKNPKAEKPTWEKLSGKMRIMSTYIQGGPKKLHKVNDTIILQPYVIESCGFQQNVPKEISYVTKVNI